MKRFCLVFCVFSLVSAVSAEVTEFVQSKWQADGSDNLNGNFSDTAHWDTGTVPTTNNTTDVNGFILAAGTYVVTNDQAATVPYLHVKAAADDKISFEVEKPLTVAPPSQTVTYYDPDKKATKVNQSARGLLLDGNIEMDVPAGRSLTVDAGTVNEGYGDRWIGKVLNGARIYVDGGTLSITNLNKGGNYRETFYVQGTVNATSRIDVVNGGTLAVDHYLVNAYGYGVSFFDYSLINIVDSTFTINNRIETRPRNGYGPTQTGPGPEIRLSGQSVMKSTSTAGDGLIRSGTYSFSGYSCFSNMANASIAIVPDREEAPCRMIFTDHASANFNQPGGYCNFSIGSLTTGINAEISTDELKRFKSIVTFDSDGELLCGNKMIVGCGYGYGELTIKKGAVRQLTNYGVSIGRAYNKNQTDMAVTGVVNVAGGLLLVNAPNQSRNSIYGLVVGDGLETSANENTNYFYGELNVSGGVVTNVNKTAIGCGTAKGVINQSGGTIVGVNQLILGLRGGTGELRMTGGSFLLPYGYGPVWLGGVPNPSDLNLDTFGTNVPEIRNAAKGLLSVRNATFYMKDYGSNGMKIGYDGTGTLELGEGGLVDVPYVYADQGATSIVKFDFSSTTSGVLQVRQRLDIAAGAKLIVDARAYQGESKWIQLVKFGPGGKYGSVQGVEYEDRFTDVTCLGNVKVVQNPPKAAVRPGIWAHYTSGLAVIVR